LQDGAPLDLELLSGIPAVQLDEPVGCAQDGRPILCFEPLDVALLVLDHPALVVGEGTPLLRVEPITELLNRPGEAGAEKCSRALGLRPHLCPERPQVGLGLVGDDFPDRGNGEAMLFSGPFAPGKVVQPGFRSLLPIGVPDAQ